MKSVRNSVVISLLVLNSFAALAADLEPEVQATRGVVEEMITDIDFKLCHRFDGERPDVCTVSGWSSDWDVQVVKLANHWANFALPNLRITLQMNEGIPTISEISSGADYWEVGNTAMYRVAKTYIGKPADKDTLKTFLSEMKAAYYEEFGSPSANVRKSQGFSSDDL